MDSFFASDLQQLNTLYARMQFSFVFLHGHAGSGQINLVRNFCAGKPALFFTATENIPSRQLELFNEEVISEISQGKFAHKANSWEQAFTVISEYSFAHRLVLVLDEFHLLAQSCPEFMEAFSEAVHHSFVTGKVFLIVLSSNPVFSSEVLSDTSLPPYDAITAKAGMGPLPFFTARRALGKYKPLEQILLYGVTGGYPALLNRINPSLSAIDNVLNLYFMPSSPMLTQPADEMHHWLREVSTYNFLLEIIARGNHKLTDIAQIADMGTNKCAKYLNILIQIDVLKKEIPAIGDVQKRVRYDFANHMLRFWYRYVFPEMGNIRFGQSKEIWQRKVAPSLSAYLTMVFEDVCSEYLERLAQAGQTPFVYHRAGSWWRGGTKREPYFRIPLVACDPANTVLGVCHCQDEPADLQYLKELQRPDPTFKDREPYYCIFSTSGFSRELQDAAKSERNIWLIDIREML